MYEWNAEVIGHVILGEGTPQAVDMEEGSHPVPLQLLDQLDLHLPARRPTKTVVLRGQLPFQQGVVERATVIDQELPFADVISFEQAAYLIHSVDHIGQPVILGGSQHLLDVRC